MPTTKNDTAPGISQSVLDLAMLGDELARRTTMLKQANDEHEAAFEKAAAVADTLVAAGFYDADQREDLLTLLRSPGGAMEVLDQASHMAKAARQAPPSLGTPVTRTKAGSDGSRPRGPGYGPKHVSDHPATLASNRRMGSLT